MLILGLWSINFHAVVVFGLGKNLLFKSIIGPVVWTVKSVIFGSTWIQVEPQKPLQVEPIMTLLTVHTVLQLGLLSKILCFWCKDFFLHFVNRHNVRLITIGQLIYLPTLIQHQIASKSKGVLGNQVL